MIGRVQSCMSEPVADHGHIDTGSDKLNADAMTPSVRRDALCRERGHAPGSRLNVLLEFEPNPRRTKRLTVSVDEDGFVISPGSFPYHPLTTVHPLSPHRTDP